MISPDYARMMARYNAWQNRSLYTAADTLSDDQRQHDCGAFFGSIEGTLSHLYWADSIWLARFTGGELPRLTLPQTAHFDGGWQALKPARITLDERVAAWVGAMGEAEISGDLTWFSGALGREMRRPRAQLIVHMFNHQTHHRGQVHALLTRFGAKPEDTDLPFMTAY